MIKKSGISFLAPVALALVFSVSYFIINYNWERLNRFDGILDIDEAGYTGIAANFAHKLIGGGIQGWLRAFTFQNIQAPFSYASSSILMYVSGLSSNIGIITSAIFGSIAILFTFILTRRLSSVLTAVVATALVISNPYFTSYARNFEFAAASACSFIAFVYFFELSEGFGRVVPSIMCGICAGLLLLSRTVNLAFVPSIAFTSIMFVIITKNERWTILIRNISLALLVTTLVAGPWYYINFNVIMEYLFSFGYGSQAAEHSISGEGRLLRMLLHAVVLFERMCLPHIVIITCAFIIYVVAMSFKLRFILQDRAAIFSFYLIALFLLCFGTLLSSDNMGSGFDVPLIPILVIGLSVGISRFIDSLRFKAVLAASALIASFVTFAPQVDDKFCRGMASGLERQWLSGATTLFACGGTILSYLQQGGGFDKVGRLASNGDGIDRNVEKKWMALNEQIVSKIDELNRAGKLVVFAHRHIVTNVNSIELWAIINKGTFIPATQINVTDVPDSVEGYVHWLSKEPNKEACIFIANTSGDGQFPHAPTYEYLRAAFVQAGMVKLAALSLPDNKQEMTFWKRSDSVCR